MSILYDLKATQPNRGGYHGGGEYAKAVFNRLVELKDGASLSAFYSVGKELDEEVRRTARRAEVDLIPIESVEDLERLFRSEEYTRCYTALPYSYYNIDICNTELIITIHGLRAVEKPTDKYEYKYCSGIEEVSKFVFKQVFGNLYKSVKLNQFDQIISICSDAAEIVVPSRHTKYSLLANFPELNVDRVRVLYSPIKMSPIGARKEVEYKRLVEYEVDRNEFFLMTSARRWIKNAYRAIKAFDELFSSFNDLNKKVLVLGARDDSPLQRGLVNQEQFVFRGYVPERDLNALYKGAYAFVYPTLNEGFGYPPLESMRYGTPVLAAATSAVTEICGDAVLYFNPLDRDEIKNRVLTFLFEEGVWARYSARGRQRFEVIKERQEHMLDELCELILGRC